MTLFRPWNEIKSGRTIQSGKCDYQYILIVRFQRRGYGTPVCKNVYNTVSDAYTGNASPPHLVTYIKN